jgi:tetratricopeptide (TPR) repeat protein
MSRFSLIAHCTLGLLLAAGAANLAAEALLRPLPQPDTSKLSAEAAKQVAQARAEFEEARTGLVGGELATAYAQVGAVYLRGGFDEVAAVAFYDASQLAPKDGRWMYMRGVVARGQKRNADARAAFEAALALDKNYLPIRYRLADTLIDLGDVAGARKVLQAAQKELPGRAPAWAMLGRLELKQKRYADAVTNLEQALKLEPQANALYQDLAAAYTGLGNAESAAAASAKVGNTPPSIDDPLVAGLYQRAPQLTGTPLEQARQLLVLHAFIGARGKVDEALQADPNDVEALALAARLDALMGKPAQAQDEAARALRLKPDSATANLSQGMVYEFAGNEAKAHGYYQRAVEEDARQPDARLLLGNLLMRRGEYARAAEQYRQLVLIDPGAEAEARQAAALVASGHCADAFKLVNGALSKRPQDGDLLQLFVRLASTCPVASEQERSMALDYAKVLYKELPDAADSTALALALAAQGKFEEAQKSQAEAIFDAVRLNDNARAEMYRETMRQYAARQMPDRPWPAQHPYFKPPALTPLPAAPQPAR